MSNQRFNPKQLRFLELYFSGCKMKTAARAAGYKGKSPQSLCNTAKKILDKFSDHPDAFFHLAGLRGLRMALLISETLDGDSKPRQLAALKILTRAFSRGKI